MPKTKRMRLPNGFGQISEIKNARLRKPFRAMVTVGKTETGKPICKLLKPEAYFRTYNEAYSALIEYNKNPYDVTETMPMSKLFDLWYAEKSTSGITDATAKDIKRLWKYCSKIYHTPVKDVRPQHIRDCIENGEAEMHGRNVPTTPLVQNKLKIIFNQLFDYALSYDIVEKNYSRNFSLPKSITKKATEKKTEHISYTDDEMEKLWSHSDQFIVQMVLIQCYSGWRPQELLNLTITETNLENWTFCGGMKTDSGKNRVVPIHSAIRYFVKINYENAVKNGRENLFIKPDYRRSDKYQTPMTYEQYKRLLDKLIMELDLDPRHRPHDGRKQFVTMCKKYDVNEYAIKKMVGHSINDITEKVYTNRDIEWYKKEIEKIK